MQAKDLKNLISRAGLSCEHVADESGLRGLAHAAREKLRCESPASVSEKPKAIGYGEDHEFTKLHMQGLQRSHGGQLPEAMDLFGQALKIAAQDGGEECLECATVGIDMARTLTKMGNPAAAVQLTRIALPIYERHFGSDSQVYAEAAYDVAMYHALVKKPSEALKLMYACRPVFMKHLGAAHPKTAQLLMAIQMIERRGK